MRRSIVLVSALVLAILGLGVYLSHSSRPASAQAITLDRSLLALLPPNATTLLGVDVERLKRTAVYRHIEEQNQKRTDSHFDDFVAATGFDPRRDVQDLLLTAWPSPGSDVQDSQFLAVARGQFNRDALGRKLRQEKAIVENYRGLDVYSGPPREQLEKKKNKGPQ